MKIQVKYKSKIDSLTKSLQLYNLERINFNRKLAMERRPILKIIEQAICRPQSRLVTVGSIATCLAQENNSDMDLLYFTNVRNFYRNFRIDRNFRRDFIESTFNSLQKISNPEFKQTSKPEMITRTHTPIITAKLENNLKVDVQFPGPNLQGLRNTNLVKYYVLSDKRLPQLFHWIRLIFSKMGIKNSKQGLFSSYQILVLAIHFLQNPDCLKTTQTVLPVLCKTHPHLVSNTLQPSIVLGLLEGPARPPQGWRSGNKSATGELAIDLIYYFSEFDPTRTAINIGSGTTQNLVSNRLLVFDPYDYMSVTRSPFLPDLLVTTFRFLRDKIEEGNLIDSYPTFPGLADEFAKKVAGKKWASLLKRSSDS